MKALGLHWRDGALLAAAVPDDAGRIKGVRPLGGTVEFGETTETALLREFREELGIEVEILRGPLVLENLYLHEGMPGHEVLFVYDVGFPAGAFDGRSTILFREHDGTECRADWHPLERLDTDRGPALFPAGLKALLTRRG